MHLQTVPLSKTQLFDETACANRKRTHSQILLTCKTFWPSKSQKGDPSKTKTAVATARWILNLCTPVPADQRAAAMPSFHTTDGVTLNYLVQGPSEGGPWGTTWQVLTGPSGPMVPAQCWEHSTYLHIQILLRKHRDSRILNEGFLKWGNP